MSTTAPFISSHLILTVHTSTVVWHTLSRSQMYNHSSYSQTEISTDIPDDGGRVTPFDATELCCCAPERSESSRLVHLCQLTSK